MPDSLFANEVIVLGNSLLVSLVMLGLWASDRRRLYNLYWAGGLFCLFLVAASLPADGVRELSPQVWLSIFSGMASIALLLQGTALFHGTRFSPWTLMLILAAQMLGFFLLRNMGVYGVQLPLLATACTFWYMAWALFQSGMVGRFAALLFVLRGALLLSAGMGDEFIRADLITLTQFVAMASSLALLFAAFLANSEELARSNVLLTRQAHLAQALGQLLDSRSIARESVRALLQDDPNASVWIYRYDPTQDKLILMDSSGAMAGFPQPARELETNASVSGLAIRTRQVQVVSELAKDRRVADDVRATAQQHPHSLGGTLLVIPIGCGDAVYGTCNLLMAEQRRFDATEIEAFHALGQTIGLGIANALHVEELSYRATHDTLTGLPNRGALHEAFTAHQPGASPPAATMLLLDLDKFKEVNDTLGHYVGDQVLKHLGARLQGIHSRAAAMVTRLGGDEFALMLFERLDDANANALGEQILDAVRKPFEVDGMSLSIDGSLGIARCPDDGADSHELLRCADVAMYRAKSSTFAIALYMNQFDPYTRDRLAMMSELKSALAEDQLLLHFQPKSHLNSGAISGVEALIRWQHPQHGLLAPGRFIPMTEVSPLINELSLWVLQRVLEQFQRWPHSTLSIAMNVSARNMADDRWYRQAIEAIQDSGVAPGRLEFELTESVLMQEPDDAAQKLSALAAAGVKISIDDFGTGYSSLNYLRKLPIRQLKIDRSFVLDLDDEQADRRIIQSILVMAKAMQLEVVAEGVESASTLQLLRELGCDYAQGYHICRPLPIDQLEDWLADVATEPLHAGS